MKAKRAWPLPQPIEPRFWRKVNKNGPNGCWQWMAAGDGRGYGSFGIGRKGRKAHIVAYEILKGPVPTGLQLDHLCRNRGCVNPDHLEPVTCRENVRRGLSGSAFRTHCRRGHEFTQENTKLAADGTRICRACVKIRNDLRFTNHRGLPTPIIFAGKTQLLTTWSRELGIGFSTLLMRLRRGWSVEKAFTTPVFWRGIHQKRADEYAEAHPESPEAAHGVAGLFR